MEFITGFDWTVVALPDRHFYWRSRGNGLSFAFSHAADLSGRYDLVVATSMVDLCSVRGFIPSLGQVPALVYFHENQFAYPTRTSNTKLINAQLTSVYTALVADCLLFNSVFNRDTFFCGAEALLKMMPDCVERNVLNTARQRSLILPVPIRPTRVNPSLKRPAILHDTGNPVHIVWNHRWEYDKQPQVFFKAMEKLRQCSVDFRLHVMGQSFREIPECFSQARISLADQIDTWGYQPAERYHQILQKAHIVVSTALHDFQGLSVLEAIHCGCLPVVPDRVAYPEYVPQALLYDVGEGEQPVDDEADKLCQKLQSLLAQPLPQVPRVDTYLAPGLMHDYQRVMTEMCGQSGE